VRPWVERVARFGYKAYGLVYVLVGVLSVRAALGGAGRPPGRRARCRPSCSPAREGPARAGRPWSARVRDVAALPGRPRPGRRGRGREEPDQTRRPRRQRPLPRSPGGERRARGARVRRRGRRAGRLDRDAPAAALWPLAGGDRRGRDPGYRPLPVLPGLRREVYGEAQARRDEPPARGGGPGAPAVSATPPRASSSSS